LQSQFYSPSLIDEVGAHGPVIPAEEIAMSHSSAVRVNGDSATFKCSKFLDLVEAAAWAAASKPVTSAHGYRTVACEFLAVLELFAEHRSVALSPWVYLAAQTLECTLKAYITRLGLAAPLRRQGHDLINLWRTAVDASATAEKKISLDARPPEWCVMLNVFHEYPFLDRYPGVYGLAVRTKRTQLARSLRKILTEVEAAFQ
jgi:hypothetical protein